VSRYRPPIARPGIAIALAVAAVALIVVSVVSAADVGYRVEDGALMLPDHHQGHVALHVFGDPPEIAVLCALAMLGLAGHYGVTPRGLRIGGLVALGVTAAFVLLACCGSAALSDFSRETDGSVVATSSRYEVVSYHRSNLFASDDIVLHLRTRNGLASYEAGYDLACFISDVSGADPEWLFDSASFGSDDTVLVTAKDGRTWPVRFDPSTLRPANPVDRCTDAPDPVGAD
jgi:hypothetical protein